MNRKIGATLLFLATRLAIVFLWSIFRARTGLSTGLATVIVNGLISPAVSAALAAFVFRPTERFLSFVPIAIGNFIYPVALMVCDNSLSSFVLPMVWEVAGFFVLDLVTSYMGFIMAISLMIRFRIIPEGEN